MIKTNTLNSKQINDITTLFSECKAYDNLTASLVLPQPEEVSEDELFLLCYDNNKLVSFLSVFSADESFVEIYGLTSPAYRKKGLFTKLLYALKADDDFILGRDILYLYDGKSSDCQLAYNRLGFTLSYSEYIMTANAPFATTENSLVKATQTNDYKLIKSLYCNIFDIDRDFADELLNDLESSNETSAYIFEKDNKIIGMMLITSRKDNSAYLWNFGLLPEYRGYKLSYAMINSLFSLAQNKFNSINIQVSSGNLPAFRLYKKAGFKITSQISYFTEGYSDII